MSSSAMTSCWARLPGSVVVDTSAFFALLDWRDAHHAAAVAFWTDPGDEDLVTNAYVVVESVALVRARLGAAAVEAFVDDLLPAVRFEMVDRPLYDASLADLRLIGGGTNVVDRVTVAFAARHGIGRAFAYDADLTAGRLAPVTR
jgi:predicted nucleic acid-binding protein